MVNILKKAASGLLEMMLSPAMVLAVRAWDSKTMYEVDLHLPTANMASWDTIKRLKCKVGALEYRDYTPSLWNSETNVCTMFIETGHDGPGSCWARQLKPGDEISYGAAHAAALPTLLGGVLCLADGSALGHFLALKQLTDHSEHPMDVAVLLPETYQIPDLLKEENPEFDFMTGHGEAGIALMEQWCDQKELNRYNSIYIAGSVPMMRALRRKLKANPAVHAKVQGYGFWS